MDVISTCPLRVGSIVWRASPEAWVLTVVCKATYVLQPGESRLAAEQDEIIEGDRYWNNDARQSLHLASDLAPFKPKADVLLVGHAFAPLARPTQSVVARLVAAGVDKSIEVLGDRVWTPDGVLRGPAPFTRMAIQWERAAGGPRTWNPVGVPANAPPNAYGMRPAPNLQPLGVHLLSPGDAIDPVGFSPIAPTWPMRASRLHGYAESWPRAGSHEEPLPYDIDGKYFNAAPLDQQVDSLTASERIVLENLHPEHARLVTELKTVVPRATARRSDGVTAGLELRADTLLIDTDRGTCAITWRGQLRLWHPNMEGQIVVALEHGGRRVSKDEVTEPLVGSVDVSATLPFIPRPTTQSEAAAEPHNTPPLQETTMPLHVASAGPVLPFTAAESLSTSDVSPAADHLGENRASGDVREVVGSAAPLPDTRAHVTPTSPNVPTDATPPASEPTAADVPIDKWAAICAELAEGRAARAEVLRAHDFNERTWAAVEQRWAKALEDEAANGSNHLRSVSDLAYVAEVERFRGVITLTEYTQIVIGMERGRVNQVLDELKIQRAAFPRIVRLWTKKVAKDPKLTGEARALLKTMRGS